jgi:DNA-binding beta-propeller fold protein YncE
MRTHLTKCHRNIDFALPRRAFALLLLGMCSSLAFALGPGELFIANYNANSVTVYSRTASGAAVATRTIRTGLTNPFGVLVDPLHGEIFVANNTNGSARVGSIQVYDLNANYPADAPKRTIAGSATNLFACTGLALDLLRQELYVANDDTSTISVFFPDSQR